MKRLALALLLVAAPVQAETLPGISYEVLKSGPATGAKPTRADSVSVRYVGRLTNGDIFSTSADEGQSTTDFKVQQVIPGFMAAIQLMRPGDNWRITLPSYLAYGPRGREHQPSQPGGPVQVRGIPPDSVLVFDVELVAIKPPAD